MKLSELKRLSHSLSIHDPGIAASRLHDELIKMGIAPGNFYQELEMDSPFVDTHRDISYQYSLSQPRFLRTSVLSE